MTFGCIIKYHDGKIILVMSRKEHITVEPTIAKLLAIIWSLQLAKQLSLKKVLVQSDVLVAVDCINLIIYNASLDIIASDNRELLENFRTCSIMFLSRTCNFGCP